jgi:hypothetical protein
MPGRVLVQPDVRHVRAQRRHAVPRLPVARREAARQGGLTRRRRACASRSGAKIAQLVRESGSLAARSQEPTHQMPRPRRRPKPDRRRALELLASCRDGCTEAIMLAHGFKIDVLVELVRAGLATATSERVVAGGRTIEVARVRITGAGRRALVDKLPKEH